MKLGCTQTIRQTITNTRNYDFTFFLRAKDGPYLRQYEPKNKEETTIHGKSTSSDALDTIFLVLNTGIYHKIGVEERIEGKETLKKSDGLTGGVR